MWRRAARRHDGRGVKRGCLPAPSPCRKQQPIFLLCRGSSLGSLWPAMRLYPQDPPSFSSPCRDLGCSLCFCPVASGQSPSSCPFCPPAQHFMQVAPHSTETTIFPQAIPRSDPSGLWPQSANGALGALAMLLSLLRPRKVPDLTWHHWSSCT